MYDYNHNGRRRSGSLDDIQEVALLSGESVRLYLDHEYVGIVYDDGSRDIWGPRSG